MSQLADQFMAALRALEQQRDVEPMARMYADDAELKRAPRERTYKGNDGVRRFWQEYLDAFPEIETRFGPVTESEGRAVMEWHSTGRNKRGKQIAYDGCSVIEGKDQVARFRTYYDANTAGMGAAPFATGGGAKS